MQFTDEHSYSHANRYVVDVCAARICGMVPDIRDTLIVFDS